MKNSNSSQSHDGLLQSAINILKAPQPAFKCNRSITRVKRWLTELSNYQIPGGMVEGIGRIVVNKGRIFKYMLLLAAGFVLFAFTATFRDRFSATRLSLYEDMGNNYSILLSDVQLSAATARRKKRLPSLYTDEQKERRRTVNNMCRRTLSGKNDMLLQNQISTYDKIEPRMFFQLYVDDQHKVIYCEVPKVACTNFKRIMLIMTGKMNTSDPIKLPPSLVHGRYMKYLQRLSSYSPKQIAYRLSEYFKFMFVREPLERTLSAYRNKFTKRYNDYFKTRFGRTIIKRYRKKPSNESLQTGNDVTFKEFVTYLIDPYTQEREEFNPHWKQYYKLCHPCHVNYDFIGKYETLDDDVDKVLDILNISNFVHFPKGRTGVATSDLSKRYFNNITSQELHKLWKLYSVDYSMFGYKYPNFR